MKKTYISPNMVMVPIMHTRPIAASPTVGIDLTGDVDAGDVEVQEVITDVNVWDTEW